MHSSSASSFRGANDRIIGKQWTRGLIYDFKDAVPYALGGSGKVDGCEPNIVILDRNGFVELFAHRRVQKYARSGAGE